MAAYSAMALVSGRIGLVRSLGRAAIPVAVAVPANDPYVPVRYSRYIHDVLEVPNFAAHAEKALTRLEDWGRTLKRPAVVFCNGESDVLLFARNRERLAPFFHIRLAPTELLEAIVDKGKFASLAEKHGLPVPATRVPHSKDECLSYAREIGFPVILKPINQRFWHDDAVRPFTHGRKAILFTTEDQLVRFLDSFPEIYGRELVQQFIGGLDDEHFDYHGYLASSGEIVGELTVQKIRTYPIHFGMGCYSRRVDDTQVLEIGRAALSRIGYVGAANINLKRDARTGRYYILEINPRFSVWTQFDQVCGANFALQQYQDALGLEITKQRSLVAHQRWLWFGHDLLSLPQYRKAGELTFWRWFRSFFAEPGKIEFHVFAWDDPLVLPMLWLLAARRLTLAAAAAMLRRLRWRRSPGVRTVRDKPTPAA